MRDLYQNGNNGIIKIVGNTHRKYKIFSMLYPSIGKIALLFFLLLDCKLTLHSIVERA